MDKDYRYIKRWKDEMKQTIRLRFNESELSDKEINKYLDDSVKNYLNNRKVVVVNNYTNKMFRMGILELIDTIEENQLITAGSACLFLQHGIKRNLLIEFILYIMDARKKAKKERAKYEKGTYMWEEWDRAQNAYKLIINSLYGCLGYPGFILFNIFLAESITSQGRQIITSAINAIENFLGDAMYFENENDLLKVVNTIDKEFYKRTKGKFSPATIEMISQSLDVSNLPQIVTERFISKCIFPVKQEFKNNLFEIFNNMSADELIMMYYKNNFIEFSNNLFIKEKYKSLILKNGPLMSCELDDYKNDECRELIKELWKLYDLFVFYNYPIFDRVRKAMYLDKHRSLYTDTDSVFLSVDGIVQYIKNEVMKDTTDYGMDKEELVYTSASIGLTMANFMINDTMYTLCKSLNITDKYAEMLKMKNEFFMPTIMFFNVKKRYISLALLQEGQLLGDGKGLPEIKGLDFIKAGTKPMVRNFYTEICLNDILYAETISPSKIFMKIIKFKAHMENEIRAGNMDFFKQATVKRPENYKNPFSTQGVNAIMLWNALCPEYELDFPNDVNIVPVLDLTFPKPPKPKEGGSVARSTVKSPTDYKNITMFAEKFPDRYSNLFKSIYCNTNPLIQHMTLTSIAIPKNIDYEIPDHIKAIMDFTSIINNNISLFLPVLKCLGLNPQAISSTEDHISNIIEL